MLRGFNHCVFEHLVEISRTLTSTIHQTHSPQHLHVQPNNHALRLVCIHDTQREGKRCGRIDPVRLRTSAEHSFLAPFMV